MTRRLVYLVTEDWYFVSHRLPLAIAAQQAGHAVTVVTRCNDAAAEIERAGIAIVSFDMARRGLNPIGLLREIFRIAKIYRQLRPDIVHHVALRPVIVGGMAARLAGVPRVVSAVAGLGFAFMDGRTRWLGRVIRRLLCVALARGEVIVQNPDDRQFVLDLGVAPGRAHLVPGAGIDLDRFAFLPEPDGMPVVMLAARLLWDKGVGEFVEAARCLRGAAQFVLVGSLDADNPASITRGDLDGWTSEGILAWWGYRNDMPSVLAQAHVFCLPSHREGFSKALLEAMACGRACVTTDAPGCRDAVANEENGLLVPVRDAAALTEAIKRLIDAPDQRRQFGRRGRERAAALFSSDMIVKQTLALYQPDAAIA